MKIFNKFVESKKVPVNKSDIWFDGDVFRIYKEGEWKAITLDIESAENLASILKDADKYYQRKLIPGKGISIENNIISTEKLYEIVDTLPSIGKTNVIYFTPSQEYETDNKLIEYVWLNNTWEKIGSFNINLEEYLRVEDADSTYLKISDSPFEIGDVKNSAILKGGYNKATFPTAFAQGRECEALSSQAHAEGFKTKARGANSHTEGYKTVTTNESEHAQGRCNKSNFDTLHSVGIGESENARKNAYEILKNGDQYMIGIGGYDGTNPTNSKSVQEVINEDIPQNMSDLNNDVNFITKDVADSMYSSKKESEGIVTSLNSLNTKISSLDSKVENLENGEISWTDVQ